METTNQFNIKTRKGYIILQMNDILFIEGRKDYSIAYTATDKYMLTGYLKIVASKLPANQFLRIHKSYIIATNQAELIKGNAVKLTNRILPVGRLFKQQVKAQLKRNPLKQVA